MKAVEGRSYDPETIEMMRTVLDEAWGLLEPKQRAFTNKTEIAVRILHLAAQGVRDPVRLRTYALTSVVPSDKGSLGTHGLTGER